MSRRLKIQNLLAIAAGWAAAVLFGFHQWSVGYVLLGVCVAGLIAFLVENQVWMRRTRKELAERFPQ